MLQTACSMFILTSIQTVSPGLNDWWNDHVPGLCNMTIYIVWRQKNIYHLKLWFIVYFVLLQIQHFEGKMLWSCMFFHMCQCCREEMCIHNKQTWRRAKFTENWVKLELLCCSVTVSSAHVATLWVSTLSLLAVAKLTLVSFTLYHGIFHGMDMTF